MNSAFLAQLQQSANKRVPLDLVSNAFFNARPDLRGSPARNSLLLEALHKLADDQSIHLPAAGSWETLGSPPLPKWILLTRPPRTAPEDYSMIAWVPELGFWPELTPASLVIAKQINAFLLRRRGTFGLAPIKERSLEIFGDEKRLDKLLGTTDETLLGGRLPLAVIGAFRVPMPLSHYQTNAPGRPVLIVENKDTYWSFGTWNQSAKRYSTVCYGSGSAFHSGGKGLRDVMQQVAGCGVEYLGDIDPTGIRIPANFNKTPHALGVSVQPASAFYQWMLDFGTRRNLAADGRAAANPDSSWLGAELGSVTAAVWSAGDWIPQESIGIEQLRSVFA